MVYLYMVLKIKEGDDKYLSFSRYFSLLINGFILLILIISTNYIGTLFPKSVIQKLDKYYLGKHIIIYLSALIFCVISNGQIHSIYEQVLTSIFIYILFLLFIKVPFTIFLIILKISMVSYLIHSYKIYNLASVNEYYNNLSDKNKVTIDDDKDNLDKNEVMVFKTLTYIQSGLFIVTILLCIIGAISKFNLDYNKHYFRYNNLIEFVFDFLFRKIKKK